jgi:hypothetical protein
MKTSITESTSPSTTKSRKMRSPRPRKREGKGCNAWNDLSRKETGVFDRSHNPTDDVRTITDPHPRRLPGVKIRSSNRWCGAKLFKSVWDLPYINKLGQFTGTTIYRWTCNSSAYITTVVSTIANRLFQYCLRHNKMRVVERNKERIVRCAYLYALTKNDYLWDRILFFSRNLELRGKLIHTICLKFLTKTNDHIRFVYSQVSLQTNWLLFRAERPRDKFAFKGKLSAIQKEERKVVNPVHLAGHITWAAEAIQGLCEPFW